MAHWISIFEQHSYSILFAAIVLELLALPISGEFFMGYAGYLVFQGKMSYFLSVLTVIGAGGIGITATYWLGRIGGYKLIEKYGRYIHLSPTKYNKIAAWMERSGSKLLAFAYFFREFVISQGTFLEFLEYRFEHLSLPPILELV